MVLLLVLFAFTQRIAEYLRLNSQLERERARLTELVATQAYLEGEIAYATSEAAVEEWARQDARWAKEGDFPVIPLAPAGVTTQPEGAAQATPTPSGNWNSWMSWLFSQ
jgi:septal ring factor EnvC (AmiA/AmiB activator)